MRFKLPRREAEFTNVNLRNEKHGKDIVPACDIKFTCKGTRRDLDMLFPLNPGEKYSQTVYDKDKNLLIPFASPMNNQRKPENVSFIVWDKHTRSDSKLEFDGCTVKLGNNCVVLEDKGNIFITGTIQVHDDPEKHSARIRALMGNKFDFELISAQDDFWNSDPEDDEDAEKAQGDMIGGKEPEEPEESEEEEPPEDEGEDEGEEEEEDEE